MKNFDLKTEAVLLNKIILMFDDKASKVMLFLKYMYDIPVSDSDISSYSTNPVNVRELKKILNKEKKAGQQEKLLVLQEVIKKCESRDMPVESIQVWLNDSLDHILNRLNGILAEDKYTKERLSVLLKYLNKSN